MDTSTPKNRIGSQSNLACVSVNAGICGFTCRIRAQKIHERVVALEVTESECGQIQDLTEVLSKLTLKALFMPATKNPVYLAAEQAGCHASCPIPMAVLKAAEVAMEMALPRDVSIQFEPCKGEKV